MKHSHSHTKLFVIIITILLIFGIYFYFPNFFNKNEIVPTAFGSSLVSSVTDSIVNPLNEIKNTESDLSFLATLVSLKTITMDASFFSLKTFKSLKSNNVVIEQVKPGRLNPFAKIGSESNSLVGKTGSSIKTIEVTDLTNLSGTLNGVLSINNESAVLFFVYGKSEVLLNIPVTVSGKPSLIGNFSKNITGLIPKTTYFYKACYKLNSIDNCGEVIKFTTH